jgi:hypothetical protein
LIATIGLVGALVGCATLEEPTKQQVITVAQLTGLDQDYALQLVRNLDLHVEVEAIEASGAESLARDVVIRQFPEPGTKVPAGSTLTLFVPQERVLRAGEEDFRLLSHCGLSLPLTHNGRRWLPVEGKLRRTINPPDGFASDGFYDNGTIRLLDKDTLIYTSSMGVEVEYAPTPDKRGTCE